MRFSTGFLGKQLGELCIQDVGERARRKKSAGGVSEKKKTKYEACIRFSPFRSITFDKIPQRITHKPALSSPTHTMISAFKHLNNCKAVTSIRFSISSSSLHF